MDGMHPLRQPEAVQFSGHHHVAEYQIDGRVRLFDDFHCIVGGTRFQHLETLVLEEIGETGADQDLVFHDQDGGRLLIVVGAHKDGTSGRKIKFLFVRMPFRHSKCLSKGMGRQRRQSVRSISARAAAGARTFAPEMK